MKNAPLAARTLAAGAVCVAILGGMIVLNAWPLWTGRTILLKAVPVDPRDPFRGEYVRLSTPANRLAVIGTNPLTDSAAVVVRPVDAQRWAKVKTVGSPWRDRGPFYVQFEQAADSAEYRPVTIDTNPVEGAVNILGRGYAYAPSDKGDTLILMLNYGIDAYYMQEGSAKAVEEAVAAGKDVKMEVAVASSGKARIRRLLVDGVPR